jgi:hypothetical protein
MRTYQQMLYDNAFGNYRALLQMITLNPTMGRYLDMLNNRCQINNAPLLTAAAARAAAGSPPPPSIRRVPPCEMDGSAERGYAGSLP